MLLLAKGYSIPQLNSNLLLLIIVYPGFSVGQSLLHMNVTHVSLQYSTVQEASGRTSIPDSLRIIKQPCSIRLVVCLA